jgi:nucleotide-binding universal stress UspA family protein
MTGPIVVPLDFSDCAPLLLEEALRYARAFDAPLVLLHVVDPPRGIPLDSVVHPPGAPAVTVAEALRRDATKHSESLRAAVERSEVPARTRVEFGPIAQKILEVASEVRASMIVMGTHGRTGLVRLTLGSVAETVIRRAEVPVVTVRTRHRPECAASSCATCSGDVTDLEESLQAEATG